jgi:hypothetical protein
VGRSIPAIKSRARNKKMSADERRAEWAAKRKKLIKPAAAQQWHVKVDNIPPEVIEDRNRRLMSARSLTATLCGDPEECRRRF